VENGLTYTKPFLTSEQVEVDEGNVGEMLELRREYLKNEGDLTLN
jgi:hypothetical protein